MGLLKDKRVTGRRSGSRVLSRPHKQASDFPPAAALPSGRKSMDSFLTSSVRPRRRRSHSFNSRDALTENQRKHLPASAQRTMEHFLGEDTRDEKELYRKSLEFLPSVERSSVSRLSGSGAPLMAPEGESETEEEEKSGPPQRTPSGNGALMREGGRRIAVTAAPSAPVQDTRALLEEIVDHLLKKKVP